MHLRETGLVSFCSMQASCCKRPCMWHPICMLDTLYRAGRRLACTLRMHDQERTVFRLLVPLAEEGVLGLDVALANWGPAPAAPANCGPGPARVTTLGPAQAAMDSISVNLKGEEASLQAAPAAGAGLAVQCHEDIDMQPT
jgi:hypothetical protein